MWKWFRIRNLLNNKRDNLNSDIKKIDANLRDEESAFRIFIVQFKLYSVPIG